jgi:hypothetical protein
MHTPDIDSICKSEFTSSVLIFDDAAAIKFIDEVMVVTAVVLGSKLNGEILNKVVAVNRYLELVVMYPCIPDFWNQLAEALDNLAALLKSQGSADVTKEMCRLSASSRDVITRIGMLPKHHA